MVRAGGTLLVGQSGGPTAVINASLSGVLAEAGRHSEIRRVYGMVNGLEGLLAEELVDLSDETPETMAALQRTPAAALGSCRRKLAAGDLERLFAVLAAHDVGYFIYAGGNDSMDTCAQVRRAARARAYPLQVLGVPKTIDNDLAHTDHCPGFGSAARFLAQTTRDTALDQYSLRTFVPVLISEIMGRNTGWLTASAGLVKQRPEDAPHLLYVPERPLDVTQFLNAVEGVHRQLGYVVVALSEGVHDAEGQAIGGAGAPADAFGHRVAALGGGPAQYLAGVVTEALGLKVRVNRPGTIQRVSSAHYSDVDIAEAVAVGAAAVRQALNGDDGYMITLEREPGPSYRCRTGLVALEAVANAERSLPAEYLGSEASLITDAFRAYAEPLLGGPLPPIARLSAPAVARRTSLSD